MSLQELVDISHYYGANTDYVIAGGGNTSFKDTSTLYIKGSGTSLSDITGDGFVRMGRAALSRIWEKTYPAESDARESAVLSDMMAAKLPGEEHKRPSVETLLHDILPFAFVVHTHPALVNGLTCSVQGEDAMHELFGDEAVWIPSANPGYVLSRLIKDALGAYTAKKGYAPAIIFLQNHGVFVGADSTAEIKVLYTHIMDIISAKIRRKPDLSAVPIPAVSTEIASDFAEVGGALTGGKWAAAFHTDRETATLVKDRAAFEPVSSAFTPDHIVYAGSDPLFIESDLKDFRKKIASKLKAYKKIPKIIAVQGVGVFGCGASDKAAGLALALFADAVKVSVYAESFGGRRFMTKEQIDFINNWEMEQYRSKVSGGE
jgi:rhamnose utilization protein RhaD (predicted bifunctional aldolase and dehydrogenase)